MYETIQECGVLVLQWEAFIVSNPLELTGPEGCFNPLDFCYLIYVLRWARKNVYFFFCFRRVPPLHHRPFIYVPGNSNKVPVTWGFPERAKGSLSRSVRVVWFCYIAEGLQVVLVNGLCWVMCGIKVFGKKWCSFINFTIHSCRCEIRIKRLSSLIVKQLKLGQFRHAWTS